MPDFVLSDASLFVGVYGEVKRSTITLEEIARSTEQRDQIGRYLAQTGVVLICNVCGLGLPTCDRALVRGQDATVPPGKRVLQKTVDLWSAVGGGTRSKVDASNIVALVDIVTAAVTRIAVPDDLAKVLARQARDAEAALPDDLRPVRLEAAPDA